MNRSGLLNSVTLAAHCQLAHLGNLLRCHVGGNRNIAMAAQNHQLHGGFIVTGINSKTLGRGIDQFFSSRQIAGGLFNTDNTRHLSQAKYRFRQHINSSTARHVVQNLRDIHSFGNRFVVKIQTFLGRFVVIRCHRKAGICASLLCRTSQLNGFVGAVGTCTRNNRNPASRLFDNSRNGGDVLLHIQSRRLARSTHCNNSIGTLLNMPLHQFFKRVPVYFKIIGTHGCHHGDQTTGYHQFPRLGCFERRRNVTGARQRAQAVQLRIISKYGLFCHATRKNLCFLLFALLGFLRVNRLRACRPRFKTPVHPHILIRLLFNKLLNMAVDQLSIGHIIP